MTRWTLFRLLLAGLVLPALEARGTLSVSKVPAPGAVSAGDVASFTYLVSNTATTATGVTLTDPLPAGVNWSDDSTACSVDATTQVLTCTFGTLPAGVAFSFSVSGATDYADCGTLSSTATITGSTGGNQSAAGVVVLCPDVFGSTMIDSVVPGQPLGMTFTVRNRGPGIARSVHAVHTVSNAGFLWALDPADAQCGVSGVTTTCELGDIAPFAGRSIHIVSNGSAADVCHFFFVSLNVTVANEPFPSCCSYTTYEPVFIPAGDANGDCAVTVTDVLYLVNFLFAGGPPPVVPST